MIEPRDIHLSKRSALDTAIRHREVARPNIGGLARGARIQIVDDNIVLKSGRRKMPSLTSANNDNIAVG